MKEEFYKLHADQRTKLIYYIMGIAVAAVGFAVVQTVSAVISWQLIPWGFAVSCWLASIVFGLKSLDGHLWMLNLEVMNRQALDGVNPANGEKMEHWQIEIAVKNAREALKRAATEVPKPFLRQRALLYVGVVAFIIWHGWRIAQPLI